MNQYITRYRKFILYTVSEVIFSTKPKKIPSQDLVVHHSHPAMKTCSICE